MSEESYLDSLLKSMTNQEDISLSEEELNSLDLSTVKDVELTNFDISGISLDDMDIAGVSDLFVDSSELEAAMEEVTMEEPEDTFVLDELEDLSMDIPMPEDMSLEESEPMNVELPIIEGFPFEESEEMDLDIPVLEESSEEMDIDIPTLDESDEIDEIPLVMEQREEEADDFMADVDGLLETLSDMAVEGERPGQNDEPDSFFSLDGLMAMDDDVFFDEAENDALDEPMESTESDLLEDIFGESASSGEGSLEDDLLGILNESSESKEEQPSKKKGIIDKLFANVHDAKSKRAHEKMLSDEEKRALRKQEREEKKAAKKAMKEDPAYIAEQEAKKKEKEEKKAQARAVKEAKKREKEEIKKQRRAEEEAEAMKDHGRINRVGAAIVFVCLGAFAASVIFGSNTFSYNQSVAKAEEHFGNREYTEAYNELCGVDLKNEDIEMYDKVVTVMYVNKQLNSYNNYYAMQMYPEALDSLLKGLKKYDNYLEAAGQLGVIDDLNYVRGQIIQELQIAFSLNEKEAYEIINMDTQQEYSQKVIEAAKEP